MSLSVCLIAADPVSRFAAILEPLRPYADEILIAADSRVDEDTLAGYNAFADRLFRIEYRFYERHLAWLYAQCSGDWILRLDGDELPSQRFLRQLPEMLASRRVQQFWVPQLWVFPDADHFLSEPPWSVDFVNRLVRNDGTLHVTGAMHIHAEPTGPCEYVEAPFYHLALLTESRQDRYDKIIRYETAQPHLLAVGGGRLNESFYAPELRESLLSSTVADEDRAPIARVLEGSSTFESRALPEPLPIVSLSESDRMWDERAVDQSAYRATVETYEPVLSFAPTERRPAYFYVTNEGTERWPASLDQTPSIRLGCRWLNADGTPHTPEGTRSAFPRVVEPGERVIVPLNAEAPATAGNYLLEVDVVHEHVRWFDCCCRVPVCVGHPQNLPQVGTVLRQTRRPSFLSRQQMRIPRTIHRVWLGNKSMPVEYERFGSTFAHHHPDWTMRLWTDDDLPSLDIGESERKRARSSSELSNLVRYEVLHRFGGVYVDTDFECMRPLTPLLRGVDAFTALESPGRVGVGVLGCTPGNRIFARAARLTRRTLGSGAHSADANGPYLFTLILEQEPDITIFGAHLFYPYRWDEPECRGKQFPDAYAIHHWANSWLAEEQGR